MKKLLLLFFPIALISCKKSDQPQIDDAIIKKYIADSSLNAIAADSGLYYVVTKEGTGSNPDYASYVTINYKGYLTNGAVFDQTAGTPLVSLLSGANEKGRKNEIPDSFCARVREFPTLLSYSL
jgi:FKBP-type peptidyl-prolyl cis-trans isomerase FkpA